MDYRKEKVLSELLLIRVLLSLVEYVLSFINKGIIRLVILPKKDVSK
jgi:hypothetical protein